MSCRIWVGVLLLCASQDGLQGMLPQPSGQASAGTYLDTRQMFLQQFGPDGQSLIVRLAVWVHRIDQLGGRLEDQVVQDLVPWMARLENFYLAEPRLPCLEQTSELALRIYQDVLDSQAKAATLRFLVALLSAGKLSRNEIAVLARDAVAVIQTDDEMTTQAMKEAYLSVLQECRRKSTGGEIDWQALQPRLSLLAVQEGQAYHAQRVIAGRLVFGEDQESGRGREQDLLFLQTLALRVEQGMVTHCTVQVKQRIIGICSTLSVAGELLGVSIAARMWIQTAWPRLVRLLLAWGGAVRDWVWPIAVVELAKYALLDSEFSLQVKERSINFLHNVINERHIYSSAKIRPIMRDIFDRVCRSEQARIGREDLRALGLLLVARFLREQDSTVCTAVEMAIVAEALLAAPLQAANWAAMLMILARMSEQGYVCSAASAARLFDHFDADFGGARGTVFVLAARLMLANSFYATNERVEGAERLGPKALEVIADEAAPLADRRHALQFLHSLTSQHDYRLEHVQWQCVVPFAYFVLGDPATSPSMLGAIVELLAKRPAAEVYYLPASAFITSRVIALACDTVLLPGVRASALDFLTKQWEYLSELLPPGQVLQDAATALGSRPGATNFLHACQQVENHVPPEAGGCPNGLGGIYSWKDLMGSGGDD